jgi:hypothetical protein
MVALSSVVNFGQACLMLIFMSEKQMTMYGRSWHGRHLTVSQTRKVNRCERHYFLQ